MQSTNYILDVPIWQAISALVIIITLDPLVYMNTVRIDPLKKKHFNFILYFLATAAAILLFCLNSNLFWGQSSSALLYLAQIFWSIALVRIVYLYDIHGALRTALATVIVVTVIFNTLEGAKIVNALDKIDTAMGFNLPQTTSVQTTTQTTTQNAAQTTVQTATQTQPLATLFGFRDKIYVRPSQVLLFLSYFINIMLPLHYFGTSYRLYRISAKRKGTREHIHDDALIKAIAVFSFLAAIMISFIFCGADIFQIGIVTAILGAGFSIAAKELISNFAAGIVLMWDNSIKRDDVITVEGKGYGWVDEISMRYTKIVDRNDMNILIPNLQLINSRIENWSRGKNNNVRLKLDIEVAYGTNLKQALEIMMDCCYHVPRVLRQRRPNALVFAAEDSGIKLQLRFWINDPKNGIRNVMSDVYLYLFEKFAQASPKIEVPYNQLEVRQLLPGIKRPI